jgi:hypothetical protein
MGKAVEVLAAFARRRFPPCPRDRAQRGPGLLYDAARLTAIAAHSGGGVQNGTECRDPFR